MATTFTNSSGETVAVRFAQRGGSVVQFEVTASEFADWADETVFGDNGEVATCQQVADSATNQVRFDNAAFQNERARQFEKGCRFEEFEEAFAARAAQARQRAQDCSRQAFVCV